MVDSYPRSLRPPRESFFLFGLRSVGKSTWVRPHFPDAPRFDLLDEGRYQSLASDCRYASYASESERLPPGPPSAARPLRRRPFGP